MENNKIKFNNKNSYKPNLLFDLLKKSYENISISNENWINSFETFDEEIAKHTEWIGKYIFITTFDDEPIGFISFDPRKKPIAELGHNCIIPEFRGKGFGEKQIKFAIEEIIKQGFEKVLVSTNDDDNFIPAQKQYLAAGFVAKGKFIREDGDKMIQYELNLK